MRWEKFHAHHAIRGIGGAELSNSSPRCPALPTGSSAWQRTFYASRKNYLESHAGGAGSASAAADAPTCDKKSGNARRRASLSSRGKEAFEIAFENISVRAENSRRVPAPSLSGDRGGDYLLGAPDEYHAIRARFEPIDLATEDHRHAVALVTNLSGMEYIGRMSGDAMDDAALAINAKHISPDQLATMLANIRDDIAHFRNAPGGLRNLEAAVLEAKNAGKSLVLAKDHELLAPEEKADALEEDLNHAAQATLTGGSLRGHLGKHAESFNAGPLATRASRSLTQRFGYRFDSPGHAAMEIGERLMRGGAHEDLGLSPVEARFIAAEYVRWLRREYGYVAPREVARRIFDAQRRHRGPAKAGRVS